MYKGDWTSKRSDSNTMEDLMIPRKESTVSIKFRPSPQSRYTISGLHSQSHFNYPHIVFICINLRGTCIWFDILADFRNRFQLQLVSTNSQIAYSSSFAALHHTPYYSSVNTTMAMSPTSSNRSSWSGTARQSATASILELGC